MSETADAATTETGAQIDAEPQTEVTDGGSTGEPQNGPQGHTDRGVREARDRYRGERDSARDELAAAQARIAALQLAEVHRLAGELAQPSDLTELGGVALADLLDDDGNVDHDVVAEAVAALIESRPGLAKNPRQPAVDVTQGLGSPVGKGQPTWSDLIRSH
jgi:hypothetical protein